MSEIQVQRDPDFYFSFRTFQVEDTLFRVPRHLFLMPNASIQPIPQGTGNDDDLVVLGPEIKKKDFYQLLRVVYPRHYNKHEILSSESWQAVLRLSETLGLENMRKKAAGNLKDIFFAGDPVEGLLCAKRNQLDDWIPPLIDKVVKGKKELTDEEAEKLGIALAMKIARAQGAACAGGGLNGQSVQPVVQDERWGKEVQDEQWGKEVQDERWSKEVQAEPLDKNVRGEVASSMCGAPGGAKKKKKKGKK